MRVHRPRLRVLHLLKTSVGATWALRQVRELVKLNVDLHVAVPDGPLVTEYAAAGATVHVMELDPSRVPKRRWAALLDGYRRLAAGVRPDVIHSHFVVTTLLARIALGRNHSVPRIFQVPGPLHLEHFPFLALDMRTAGDADYWIGACEWTVSRYLAAGVSPRRVSLAHYGIDLAAFQPRPTGRLRQELGLSTCQPLVGMVAYMYAPKRYLGQRRGLKGHEDLIDAIAICAEKWPTLKCVIVGGAWAGRDDYEARVRDFARRRCGDRVTFLGTRPDVADLYPDFDLAVHPSHSENLGGAGESLLLGVPTVATTVGGFPDLVQHGRTGWLVPPRAPTLLAGAIDAALCDPGEARRLAEVGRLRARELLDVERTGRAVYDTYHQILDSRIVARTPRDRDAVIHR